MKSAFRILAVLIAVAALIYWAAAGANLGWNKNRVQVKVTDEVTGIDQILWQDKFIPGLEFLSMSLGGAALLGAASFLFRNKKSQTSNQS
jgi:hypothetical protein